MQYLLGIMMFLTALFLILLVLIQRGRGGGLAGAFGGAGGQSAFGTKAGDMFTKITVATAALWIVLNAFSVWMLNSPKASVLGSRTSSRSSQTGSSDDTEFGLDSGGRSGDVDNGGVGSGTATGNGDQPDGGDATSGPDPAAADSPTTTPPSTNDPPTPGE